MVVHYLEPTIEPRSGKLQSATWYCLFNRVTHKLANEGEQNKLLTHTVALATKADENRSRRRRSGRYQVILHRLGLIECYFPRRRAACS
ncbi:hypothetical protein EVAR_16338_1 [Eumeta japonica]|uniref:Uncharacterized protein n=1 Tax=Eumeta variegata TaxID=151549 RepID=A0A4C1VFM3_EUMVA|nr:hypothetical protein EVAR_16338_1 [Eumeta japonica]